MTHAGMAELVDPVIRQGRRAKYFSFQRNVLHHADVVELVDTLASGASESNLVWVRVPPSARSFVCIADDSL